MDVKITTYNIHSCVGTDNCYSIDRIVAVVRNMETEILCLQEVEVNEIPTKTRVWSLYHNDDQPAVIAARTGLTYYAFVPAICSKATSNWKEIHQNVSAEHESGNIALPTDRSNVDNSMERQPLNHKTDPTMGKFGISILSKFPILKVRTHYYKRYKKKTQRNAMACLIRLPNRKLVWVVNTHLGCHFIGREQAQQAKELAIFVHALERGSDVCGVVVCGDTNSPPWYSCIREMKQQGFQDVWKHSRRLGGTFPSHRRHYISRCFRKQFRLDYIFLSGGVVCGIAYVYDDCSDASLASDHLPVCAVLFIDKKI